MPIENTCDLCDASYFTHKLMALISAYEKNPTQYLIDKMAEEIHNIDMLDEDVWGLVTKCHHEAIAYARKLIKHQYK